MCQERLREVISRFIFSVSGWRSIYALEAKPENSSLDESLDTRISNLHTQLMIGAGYVLGEFYKTKANGFPITLALGRDTRPTGKAIEKALLKGLLTHTDIEIAYLGHSAICEIMAYTAQNYSINGFIYISASHNPPGYNGLKMGLEAGGCLKENVAQELIEIYKNYILSANLWQLIETVKNITPNLIKKIEQILTQKNIKEDALKAYFHLAENIVLGTQKKELQKYIKEKISSTNLGIVAEMNGSARISSIDFNFLRSLGLQVKGYNTQLGNFVHSIVPEGKGLELCCQLLKSEHSQNPSYILGYVPDCDGDRGNLVFYNESTQTCECLDAQTSFSLVVVAQLSAYLWQNSQSKARLAIVINDATSLRIEEIVHHFHAQVFRCEVGEANVVNLADKLEEKGYKVLVVGEGSNGGSIIPPSRVRDPLYTICSVVKLLSIAEIYNQWFFRNGISPPSKRSIFQLIKNLPTYTTTSAFEDIALIQVKNPNQSQLKKTYVKLLKQSWKEIKEWLPSLVSWSLISYEGTESYPDKIFQQESATGGLKILLKDQNDKILGSLWLRQSKTEPIFRLLVDLKGTKTKEEKALLAWHKNLLRQADKQSFDLNHKSL